MTRNHFNTKERIEREKSQRRSRAVIAKAKRNADAIRAYASQLTIRERISTEFSLKASK